MFISTEYNDALDDAKSIQTELEKDLKELGYMDMSDNVEFDLNPFIPGGKEGLSALDVAFAKLDWQVKISVPTFPMTKNDALNIAEIIRYHLGQLSIKRKYHLIRNVFSRIGFIRFDKCRRMTEEDDEYTED
jgi:hypothetical protein